MDYAQNYRVDDPIDHYNTTRDTTRQHAGETLKNGANSPGLAGIAAGVIALIVGLAAFASGHTVTGAMSLLAAVSASVAGIAWLSFTHRQVRQAELHWHAEHATHPAPPPTS